MAEEKDTAESLQSQCALLLMLYLLPANQYVHTMLLDFFTYRPHALEFPIHHSHTFLLLLNLAHSMPEDPSTQLQALALTHMFTARTRPAAMLLWDKLDKTPAVVSNLIERVKRL